MMECLQFFIEPAKSLIKESQKKTMNEKKEPLVDSQVFIMELAKDLNRVCQRSDILKHIWTCEDTWPPCVCQVFILEWASVLESKQRPIQKTGPAESCDWSWQFLGILEQKSEQNMEFKKQVILNWTRDLKAQPDDSVWPGQPVVQMLDDMEIQWGRGQIPNLLSAMEVVLLALLTEGLDKETTPQQWLTMKQRIHKIDAARYIPQPVWKWIRDAAVEVVLDPDTANPDLLISPDDKRMRCGFERKDVPNHHQRFDGWWCAAGTEGFTSGRHYWEVEVGERDWRLGIAKESALRKGFKSLNTYTGYLTLRLERGTEMKALTVPFTPLPAGLIPRKVGVYLDYEAGQLSFYDAESRSHIYTYNETFTEKLYPLFGTVEIIKDLVIRSAVAKDHRFCPDLCLWG